MACTVRMVKEAPVAKPSSIGAERYTETNPSWNTAIMICRGGKNNIKEKEDDGGDKRGEEVKQSEWVRK